MSINRGKQFEDSIRKQFQAISDVSIDRLADPTSGYLGIRNVSDFIVYKKPHEYYLECKTIHGSTFPLTNISKNQYEGMLEKSKINGVICGILLWFVDKNITLFIPIDQIRQAREYGKKSIRYDDTFVRKVVLSGKKRRVLFEYDLLKFFEEVNNL